MTDLKEREQLMQQDVLLIAIAGASLLNGMPFSPVLFPVVVLMTPFLAGTLFGSELVITYLSSFLASAATAVIAGAPAALYERFMGLTRSTTTSLLIWLAATIALVALPFVLVHS